MTSSCRKTCLPPTRWADVVTRSGPRVMGWSPCGTPHPFERETTSDNADDVTCYGCLEVLARRVEAALEEKR